MKKEVERTLNKTNNLRKNEKEKGEVNERIKEFNLNT